MMIFGKIHSTLIIAVALLMIVTLSFIFYRNTFKKPGINIDLSHASVIKEIQTLNRLETSSYTIEKIVEAGQQGNPFQDLLYGDRILLIAHGKVVAGVDMSTVGQNDVTIKKNELTITLPPPSIFSTTLDNSKTRVYDRTQGFLSRGNKDLESEARQAAEASIHQAACEAEILEEARTSAIARLRQLFQFAGFTTVHINIAAGNC